MKSSLRILSVLMLCFFAAGVALAQPQPPAMSVEKITGNLYMVQGGSGANTGFFLGPKGVLVIDAKMSTDSARQMIDEIKKVTPLPITTIVLTHSDGDHVNGLTGFPQGLEIISNVHCRQEMEEAFKDPKFEALRPYLPNKTFTDKMDLKMGAERIELRHYGPAHTSGDTVIFFPAEKVAFVGDLVFIGRDPLVHRQKGGTSIGLVKTLHALAALPATKYVTGHSGVVSKSDIEKLTKSIEEKQAKIRTMIQEGQSLDDVKKAFGVEDRPGRHFMSLVEVIYLDLKEAK